MRTPHPKSSEVGLLMVATIVASLLVLAGCSSGSEAEPDTAGPLRIASPWEITSLDPVAEGFWSTGYGYGETLLRQTPEAVPEPWILESAEAVSDTEWELTLQEGVTFHNGNPLDGKALAALLNYQIAENPVLEPFLSGAVAKATGPTTVTLTTKSPVSFVPNLLSSEEAVPVYDARTYKKLPSDDAQALLDAGLYTGPYEVTELNVEHLVAKRYDDYWKGTPALPGVEVKFIADPQARGLGVESGEIDIAMFPPTEVARRLESSSAAHFLTSEYGTLGPRVIFNLDKAPITDVLVRRALSAAVDYEAIANDVMDGYYNVAEGLYPMHLPFAVANQAYDPERAGDLLDQAGWVESGEGVRTKNGQPLELTLATYRTAPDLQPIAVALRSQLEQVGIALKIREIDSSSVLLEEDFTDWHFAILVTSYFGNTGSIVEIVHDYMTSDGARNFAGISDPEIDALADEMSRTFDQERLYDLLRELQNVMIAEKAYTIVVAEQRDAVVASDAWAEYDEVTPHFQYVDWETAP